MKRAYLLVYNITFGPRDRLKKWADASPLVVTWRFDLPSCMYLISESTAAELCKDIERVLGARGRYLITEIADNRQGRLPAETWQFLRTKSHKASQNQVS